MGSHLSGKVHAGRCRVRRGLRDEVVSVVGHPGHVQVGQQRRQILFEASRRGHASCPPATAGTALGIAGHGGAHRGERVVQPGLRGAEGDAQGRRHVGQRHPEQVVQGDDRAMPGIETRERLVEQLAVGDGAGHVRDRGSAVERAELDLDHPAPPAPDEVETGIDE